MQKKIQTNIIEPLKRLQKDKGFVFAVLIMMILAIGFQASLAALRVNLVKQAIPLQNRLDFLDEAALYPYFVPELIDRDGRNVAKQKIENKDMEDELGTTDYIIWWLEDSEPLDDSVSMANLFITYYTGDAGKVPHIPNACYAASGSVPLGDYTTVLDVPGVGLVPINILYFRQQVGQHDTIASVAYFFSANGQYAADRNAVRVLTHNWRDKYAYFSKVEIKMTSKNLFNRNKVESDIFEPALVKLLSKLLPELNKSHWPIWPPDKNQAN